MPTRRKLAIILPRFPFPLDKGDKLRAYHQLVHLSKTFDIHLFCLTEDPVPEIGLEHIKSFCVAMHVFHLRRFEILVQTIRSVVLQYPVQVGYFYSPRIHRLIADAITRLKPDAVYCQLSRTALYGKDLPFRKVIDFQDAFSKNYERTRINASGLKALFYRYEAGKMRSFETRMLGWFDEATIISAFDREAIPVQPNRMVVVGNGVDTSFFTPIGKVKQADVLFSGNLSYLPNRQAVEYLVEKICPLLIAQRPSIRIRIVGASGRSFMHYQSEHIRVCDWVDDIREEYAGTRLFVAPLFTGAGLQNKLLEAMSMGIPCIATSVVNASLNANDGEHLLIADDAGAFARHILELLDHPEHADRIAGNGRAFVTTQYNWETETNKLAALL